MKIKDNSVRIDFSPQLTIGLYQFDFISMQVATKQAIITSGSESTTPHSETSLHYSGNAADLRIKHYLDSEIQMIKTQFEADMNCDFDLVLEGNHFHLEYQPKKTRV